MIPVTTADGSTTLFHTETGEAYKSLGGAVTEAEQVYVRPALDAFAQRGKVKILEIGFGTGLNAALTCAESTRRQIDVEYETIEPYPVPEPVYSGLDYPGIENFDRAMFFALHACPFDVPLVRPRFTFVKRCIKAEDYVARTKFDVIYFDAFSPDAQPEMWSFGIFAKMYGCLHESGILLTYSARGSVKKNLRDAGFSVIRLPGAGNKRHRLKAVKEIVTTVLQNSGNKEQQMFL
jgi:tRNA U34 5-methylaminomethyl-2-thiouridine-forming methyltransferase MnmC